MLKDLCIIGAGDFGREVVALINRINGSDSYPKYNIVGFIDDNKSLQGKIIDGIPVIGTIEWLNNCERDICAVCSVGTGHIRKSIISKITNKKISFPNLIDPNVIFLNKPKLGEGNIICSNNVISVNVSIGNHVIVNLSCTLGHDDILGDFCTINPGSNISGFVELKECVDIGTGTKIIQHITIGNNTIIGAGAVVIRNIESNVTAVGSPAKVIKHHRK